MYVRFVLPKKHPDTGVDVGVFNCAYDLQCEGDLTQHERDELDKLLRWFGERLDVPARFNRTKSKGYSRRATKGISWFKSTARQHVSKMQRMAVILRNQGYFVNMIKARNPGYIVYEDNFQVVAEPFNDFRKHRASCQANTPLRRIQHRSLE
jgi:hypothetical protein